MVVGLGRGTQNQSFQNPPFVSSSLPRPPLDAGVRADVGHVGLHDEGDQRGVDGGAVDRGEQQRPVL